MFVSDERVAVTVDGKDVIYIRPKMGAKTKALLQDQLVRITGKAGDEAAQMEFTSGAYQIALLVANIVGWEGPGFDTVKCVAINIERLDPDTELYDRVLGEIAERNPLTKEKAPDPNSSSAGGQGSSLASTKAT